MGRILAGRIGHEFRIALPALAGSLPLLSPGPKFGLSINFIYEPSLQDGFVELSAFVDGQPVQPIQTDFPLGFDFPGTDELCDLGGWKRPKNAIVMS